MSAVSLGLVIFGEYLFFVDYGFVAEGHADILMQSGAVISMETLSDEIDPANLLNFVFLVGVDAFGSVADTDLG